MRYEDLSLQLRQRVSEAISEGCFEPPRPPDIALEVMRLAKDPDSSLASVSSVIARDAFLAGEVLRISNSAYHRPRDRTLSSLPQAVSRLGLREVRNVIFAVSVKQSIFRGPRRRLMTALWQRALGTAVACQLFAESRRKDLDRAYLLGLLVDVGKPVLVWILDELTRSLPKEATGFQETLDVVFREHHAKVGALILRFWGLSTPLVELVACHHESAPPPKLKYSFALIRAAEQIQDLYARHGPLLIEQPGVLDLPQLQGLVSRRALGSVLASFPGAVEAYR